MQEIVAPFRPALMPPGSPGFDIIVMTASFGGFPVLETICSALPAAFATPILLVQHLPPRNRSCLVDLLARQSNLPVVWAVDNTRPRAGSIHVAPPTTHLTLTRAARMQLTGGPPENFVRPAADPLFISTSRAFGARTLAVVLSGRLMDGAAGASVVRQQGGGVIVQSPETCRAPGMPQAAIATGAVHFVLPPDKIASALVTLTMVPGARTLFGVGRAA